MTDIEVQESYTDHDGGEFSAVNVRVVATSPAPTFVENLAIDPAGVIFVSLYSHNRVDRYDPATGAPPPLPLSRHRRWVSPSMRMAPFKRRSCSASRWGEVGWPGRV